MANQEHLDILELGVGDWNRWRNENQDTLPDLSEADLSGIELTDANLIEVDLSNANLQKANLMGALCYEAKLRGANLSNTKLIGAKLNSANLTNANLVNAELNSAHLIGSILKKANLIRANLINADLSGANLIEANLHEANLTQANLSQTRIGGTIFGVNDLSLSKGLDAVIHIGPSIINIDTIYRSDGKIPEVFLRGTGVPEDFITYMHSLSKQAKKFYSCFISYSNKDQEFAKSLYEDLQRRGVRCWYAPEKLEIGAKFRSAIDESIYKHDKLLIVLSKNSIASAWVGKEVETAMERERNQGQQILFPVKLDEEVMTSTIAWAADIRRTTNIGNFAEWKNKDKYQKALDQLLHDLQQRSRRRRH